MEERNHYRPVPRGTLPLRCLGVKFDVLAGPYAAKPASYRGVCVAREIATPRPAVRLGIQDFGVPTHAAALDAVERALGLLVDGEPIYVGCRGGIGRTGLFLALLAKTFGYPDPVAYVRKHYYEKAVETSAQERFVDEFDPGSLEWGLRLAVVRRIPGWLLGRLTG